MSLVKPTRVLKSSEITSRACENMVEPRMIRPSGICKVRNEKMSLGFICEAVPCEYAS